MLQSISVLLSLQNQPIKDTVKRLKEMNADLKQPFLLLTTSEGMMNESANQKMIILDHTAILLPSAITIASAFYCLYACHYIFHVEFSKNALYAFQVCDLIVKPRDAGKPANCVKTFYATYKMRTSGASAED